MRGNVWTPGTQYYNNSTRSRPMHAPVSLGTTLLAMSAPRRMALAAAVAVGLWLCAWWAL